MAGQRQVNTIERQTAQKLKFITTIGSCGFYDEPEVFFDDYQRETAAKAICHRCPVKSLCLEYALENDEVFGIWGGTTPSERRQIKGLNNG